MRVKTDSRCRVGIDWYDDEAEAVAAAAEMFEAYRDLPEVIQAANAGYVQVGRSTAFDYTDESGTKLYAVVTP